MEIRVIKDEKDYRAMLNEAEQIVAQDPNLNSKEAERLELLALLIEDYEKRAFQFEITDPIDAIEFRMNEQGLRQRDLIALLGSRSRVSEVLSRKRPLTVQMIRAISTGLGIPVETLVAESLEDVYGKSISDTDNLDWNKFPVRAMEKKGWFESIKTKTNFSAEAIMKEFMAQVTGDAAILFRRRFRGEEIDERSYYSTLAWTARILIRTKTFEMPLPKFDINKLNMDVLHDLARLSWFEDGPKLAIEYLAKCGIATVIEPRLPNALIDGAAILTESGIPIIGLTLRIDRIDYFWFTLMHEVAHIWKHLNTTEEAFVDRIENMGSTVLQEKEANRIARDAFIRRSVWERSPARITPSKRNIQEFADSLHIHPAIVAGRLQYETGNYQYFREFLGQGKVRNYFPALSFS